MRIAIITINQPSLDSGIRLFKYLQDDYSVELYSKDGLRHQFSKIKFYNKLDDILPNAWKAYDIIIPILAIGAVVRKIAPLLQNKSIDPAVVIINLNLDKVVPLLSGHLGGANLFAEILTKKLPNCINFISTATDQTNTLSFDTLAMQNNWQIQNLNKLANISNRLLNKLNVKVYTKRSIFNSIEKKDNIVYINKIELLDGNSVIIDPLIKSDCLVLRPKLSLGIGCNRNTSKEQLEEAYRLFLDQYDLKKTDIQNIGTFEAKSDEKGLVDFAKKNNLKIIFFKKEEINQLENKFSSSASTRFFGLKGVAEPSSILASIYKELIIKKQVYFKSITIAASI
jgi:cobalt-precorrin 5A hydrolase